MLTGKTIKDVKFNGYANTIGTILITFEDDTVFEIKAGTVNFDQYSSTAVIKIAGSALDT